MDNGTFCPSLWNHQMIDTAGNVKPCCRFNDIKNTKLHSIRTQSIVSIFTNDYMEQLRYNSANGVRSIGCKRCYEEQDNHKKSLRERINENSATNQYDLNSPAINYLELSISNNCNLMCRMCDSRYSFKLFDDELALFEKPYSLEKYTKTNIDAAYDLLENLKYIKFTGGEPLIIKEHWELLEDAVTKGYAKDITLNYSTNCTIFPKPKMIDLWKQFKKIEISLSLDSIVTEENEYQRYRTVQDDAILNIKKFIELSNVCGNVVLSARPTVTIFNLYHLPETIEWLSDAGIKTNPTHLTMPKHLSITILPVQDKEIVKEKFESFNFKRQNDKNLCQYILNYMFSEQNDYFINEFRRITDYLDKQRGQCFKTVYYYYKTLNADK